MNTATTVQGDDDAGRRRAWPHVAIVVLNWNRCEDTLECLGSLQRLRYPSYQIIVVDNGSTDGSAEKITAWAKDNAVNVPVVLNYSPGTPSVVWPDESERNVEGGGMPIGRARDERLLARGRVTIIRLGANLGFAGGNNVGIRYALGLGCDYILILNNDTVVHESALREMVGTALLAPAIGMVAPAVYDYCKPNLIDRLGVVLTKSGLAYDRKNWEDGPLFCPSGCAALYSRSLLSAVQFGEEFFDEDFFAYSEDVDLGFRAQLRGFRATLAEDAIVYHKGSASSGGRGSLMSIYLGHRNTIWTIIKNYPVRLLLRNILWIVLGQIGGLGRNVGYPEFWGVARGKFHGLVNVGGAWRKRRAMLRPKFASYELPIHKKPFYLGRGRARRFGPSPGGKDAEGQAPSSA